METHEARIHNQLDDVRVALRAQAARACLASREYTGAGFHCSFEVPAEVPRVSAPSGFELGLEHGAGFLLFVRDGRMTMLEGYSYEEPWPADVRDFKLTYRNEPRELAFS